MITDKSLHRYHKRDNREITAVQVRLELDNFTYQKWGATQTCKAGDWIVDNQDDIYTVDQSTFAATYEGVGPGRYIKVACVWAERAVEAGVIATKEGATHYAAGDWLVYNGPARSDGYAMSDERFTALYQPVKGC